MEVLTKVCLEGLLASFRARIHNRLQNEHIRWNLHRYIGAPRIVSTRVAFLPVEKSALYQVVVKIKSIQSLKSSLVTDAGNTKHMVEYLVLQRRMWKGAEESWKIWGTVEETKVEDVLGHESVHTPAMGK